MAWSQKEFEIKLDRVRGFMSQEGIANLLIQSQANFIWLTGGRPFINRATDMACGYLLVTNHQVCLVASNIEADRLMVEELAGLSIGKEEYPWWEPASLEAKLRDLAGGSRIFTDGELGNKFNRLRWHLLPEERQRYSKVGRLVGAVLQEGAFALQPGDSEEKVAGMLSQAAIVAGLTPMVVLVAADDRAFQYRHPLPTGKRIDRYVLMSISSQKYGLWASATRLVHFGAVPRDLQRRYEVAARVDATLISATVPGAKVKDILGRGIEAYEELGFPNEWKNHHQGGLAGYASREYRATPVSEETVAEGQAYAWNPTVAGAKSEDTILVENNGLRVITVSGNFPLKKIDSQGFAIERPDILVR